MAKVYPGFMGNIGGAPDRGQTNPDYEEFCDLAQAEAEIHRLGKLRKRLWAGYKSSISRYETLVLLVPPGTARLHALRLANAYLDAWVNLLTF